MSKLVDLVASAPTVPLGAAILVRGLAPDMPEAEARALVGALTRNTTHIAIRADHPGFDRAQRIFEGDELEAAAQLAKAEARISELEAKIALARPLHRGRAAP